MPDINELYRVATGKKLDDIPKGFLPYIQALQKGRSVTWFDFETTGTNIYKGAIPTEIATMTLHPSGKVSHFSTILQTGGRAVSAEGWKTAAQYGGITREMMKAGMPLEEAAHTLRGVIGEGMIAGQNIKAFDVPFLEQLFNMTGVKAPAAVSDVGRQFDLLQAMRARHGDKYRSYAMSAVERRLDIMNPDAHRALADVWTEMTAAHRELGLPEAAIPEDVYTRMRGVTSPTAAVIDRQLDDALGPLVSPSERAVIKQTGAEIGAELKGVGKTLMSWVKKNPLMAAGAAALGGAWLVRQMRENRRTHPYNMQATPAQMNRAYHANRVYV